MADAGRTGADYGCAGSHTVVLRLSKTPTIANSHAADVVGVANFLLTRMIPDWYGAFFTVSPDILPGLKAPAATPIKTVVAIWAVQGRAAAGYPVRRLHRLRTHQLTRNPAARSSRSPSSKRWRCSS